MGQYGNQPDFATRVLTISPKGFAQGDLITITYKLDNGDETTQRFTSRNLDVTIYKDGTVIPQATDASQWEAFGIAGTGCWAYYNYDPANGPIYGKIYNGHAIDEGAGHSTICPNGFILPSKTTFEEMTNPSGKNPTLGQKIKSKGVAENGSGLWVGSPGGDTGTDVFNFTGLPGGRINEYGGSEQSTEVGNFWSNDINVDGNLLAGYIAFNNLEFVTFNANSLRDGYSVRLVPTVGYKESPKLNSAALYVGSGGDLVVTLVGDTEPTVFRGIPSGTFFPVIVDYVWESSNDSYTTASNIVALY
jgi:uncharacterized protein (TIGR02145 family)